MVDERYGRSPFQTGHATSTSYDDTQFAPGSFPRTANEARARASFAVRGNDPGANWVSSYEVLVAWPVWNGLRP